VDSPDPLIESEYESDADRRRPSPLGGAAFWGFGERLGWVAGLVLTVSAFTGWYSLAGDGITTSVLAWHTGVLGKLLFFIGVAVLLLAILREFGIEPPAAVPESLVMMALGALATIFVLVRVISIPDDFVDAGRSVGIWISLAASLALIVAGLLQASEEL